MPSAGMFGWTMGSANKKNEEAIKASGGRVRSQKKAIEDKKKEEKKKTKTKEVKVIIN